MYEYEHLKSTNLLRELINLCAQVCVSIDTYIDRPARPWSDFWIGKVSEEDIECVVVCYTIRSRKEVHRHWRNCWRHFSSLVGSKESISRWLRFQASDSISVPAQSPHPPRQHSDSASALTCPSLLPCANVVRSWKAAGWSWRRTAWQKGRSAAATQMRVLNIFMC